MKKVLIVVFCIALYIGGWFLYGTKMVPWAEITVKEFHDAYNRSDFGYMYDDLTSNEFKKALPYEPFRQFMETMRLSTGEIKDSKKGEWGIFYKNVGLTVNISYESATESGPLHEYFTLVKRGSEWKVMIYDPKNIVRE